MVKLSLHLEEAMEKPVLAADASRKFSKLLREVREGKSYVVTSHGRAVARIVPAEKDIGVTRAARAALLKDSGPSQWLQSAVGGGMNFMRIKSDAVILSAAAESGCRLLLSQDLQEGFTWNGVTVTNPFAPRKVTCS